MSVAPVIIREATIEDIPFLQEMMWEALLASPNVLAQVGVEVVRQQEKEYWEQWPQHPDPAFVALDTSGQKLGVITIQPNDTEQPVRSWRIGIGVVARARSQGVGHRLIEQSISYAREQGAQYVSLHVDLAKTGAIALYTRMGFIKTSGKESLIEMRINLS